jgi:hypothetical protein
VKEIFMTSVLRSSALTLFGLLLTTGCTHVGFIGGDDGGSDAGSIDAPSFQDVTLSPTGAIRVNPSTASVEIDDGQTSGKDVAFTADQLQPDGTWKPVTSSCSWTLANVDVGTMSGATFQPSGDAGAHTSVTCAVGAANGNATLDVTLVDTVDPNNVDGGSKTALLGATAADPTLTSLLYPYDKTVFPRGLAAAPEVMWTAPASSDVYAFVYEEPYAKVTAYFDSPDPGRFLLPLAEWDKLGASNPDGKLQLKTYRLAGGSGGTAYVGPTQTWTMSRASLKGTAYFWQLTNSSVGDIVRMPFKQSPQVFLDKTSANGHCTGCHSVAAKADVIAAGTDVYVWGGAFKKGTGTSIWEDTGVQTGFRAVSPDGSVIASLNAYGPGQYFGSALYFLDANTGQQISGAPSYGLTNTPAFSSSGKLFAFSVRQASDYATYGGKHYHDEFCGPCDIAIADYDSSTHTTSNPRTLVTGQGSQCNVFPTVTPDDSSVVFARALSSENRWHSGVTCENSNGPNASSLWIVGTNGQNAMELANASASDDPLNKLHNYRPIFSPVVQGGYFWLMFTGLRTYGNRLTATDDYDTVHCQASGFSDCRHQQIWVAAVDVKTGTTDPSHPAFWLPGQDTQKQNFDAQWSLDACKADGDSCEAGFECCNGTCQDVNGKKVCNPPTGCRDDGDVCSTGSDCCTGEACIGGVCTIPVQ